MALEAYRRAAPWKGFGNIVAIKDGEYPEEPLEASIDGINYLLPVGGNRAIVDEFQAWGWTTDVVIPESVSYNGKKYTVDSIARFWNGRFGINMWRISIPGSIHVIPDSAFAGSLVNVVRIQEGVTKIGTSAFAGCYQAESIVIPESVTMLGDYAFQDCEALESVSIPGTIRYIPPFAFDGSYH